MFVAGLLVGILVGFIMVKVYERTTTVYGYFIINLTDEEDSHVVNMRIPYAASQGLDHKNKIVLEREFSQK